MSPDGKFLASSGATGSTYPLILWDLGGEPLGTKLVGHANLVTSVAYSPDGKKLISGSEDGVIIEWDTATNQPIGKPLQESTGGPVQSLSFIEDGKLLAAGSNYNRITLRDIANMQVSGPALQGQQISSQCLTFSSNGSMLATECWNGFITFWDVPNRKPIGQPLPVGSVNGVSKVAFSPDGKILASGDRNDKIILWNVASRQPIGKPLLPTSDSLGVVGIAYNPSGTILISAYTFGPIVLWNVNTHQIIRQLSTHDFASFIPVQDLAVSQDGREVAARDAGTVVLWDATTGQSIGQPLGHPNGSEYSYGEDLAFSPDGRALAFGGCNQWDANGHCLEGKITIIDLDPQSLIERTCKRAGRNFTKDEWDQYFPGEPYQLTCPEWPANIQVTPTSTPTALP